MWEGSISHLKFFPIQNKNNKKASYGVIENDKDNKQSDKNTKFQNVFFPFHEHSLFPGQQEKGVTTSLIPLYHFYPLHRHLDISRSNAAESSPLANRQTRIKNLWFLSTSR